MRDSIRVSVRTNCRISAATLARAFIQDLFALEGGRLSPEYFNLWEPINRSFAKEGIEGAVRLWSEPNETAGGFLIRRRSSPQLQVIVEWTANMIPDAGRFPWFCSAYLESLKQENAAMALLPLLVSHFRPAYGAASLSSDQQAKHKFIIDEGNSTLERSVGVEPGPTIPGIYWRTFLGPWAIEKIGGSEKIESLPVGELEKCKDGYLITAYPHVKQAGTPEAREIEERIKDHLGREHFFDRDKVDIDSLRTPPHVRKATDQAIQKMLAEGKKSTRFET